MITSLINIIFVFCPLITAVHGKPFRLKKIPQGDASFGCKVCHVKPNGGPQLGPFGKDYKKIAIPAGETYTRELGKKDSDGDGFTNDKEFESGTNPGDPESHP